MTCLLICREESRFEEWRQKKGARELHEHMGAVLRLPNPVFPQTDRDPDGRDIVKDQALLDIFSGKITDWSKYNPATVGAIQSHRNAWLWAENHTPTEWLMVVEDDIEPREACVDRLLVVLHAIAKNPKVTQMAMLAGSEAPRMVSLQRENSTSIHNCERLLDVRTYPAHWVDNTFVVPYHVGMGLKWYLISPEGRKALLKMRIPNRSFERCVWRRLFDTFQGPVWKWEDCLRMTSVLAASPVLASTPESMDTEWGGSGRRSADAGHSMKPYIMIDPSDDWTLGERLNTLSVVMSVCAALSWGVVLVWEKTERVPISYEDLCGVHEHAGETNTFVHLLQDKRGGSYSYFLRYGDIRIHVVQPMMCIPTLDRMLDMVAMKRPKMNTLPPLKWQTARWIQVKQKWIDKLHTEMPGAELPSWLEWPPSTHALVLCDDRDLAAHSLEGRCQEEQQEWMNGGKDNSIQYYILEAKQALQNELEDILKGDSSSRLVVIRMTTKPLGQVWVGMMKHLTKQFRERIITPTFLLPKMIPKRRHDEKNPSDDWITWGASLAKTVGLLTLIPPMQVHYPIMSWTVAWNHFMFKGRTATDTVIPDVIRTLYAPHKSNRKQLLKNGPLCQTRRAVLDSPALRDIANNYSRAKDKTYNLLSYSKWFAEEAMWHMIKYAESTQCIVDPFVSRQCQKVFEHIPSDDIGHADARLRYNLQDADDRGYRFNAGHLYTAVQGIKTVNIAYNKWLTEQAQSHSEWSWGKTFIKLVINQWRQQQGSEPYDVDEEEYVSLPRTFHGNSLKLARSASLKDTRSCSRSSSSYSRSPSTNRTEAQPSKRARLTPAPGVKHEP